MRPIGIELGDEGYFLARPTCVGLTEDEAARLERGALETQRYFAMLEVVRTSLYRLSTTPTMGSC